LNGANEIIEKRIVTVGLLDKSQVHPREVFADVITDRAASVILAHNHPSGELKPSNSDLEIHEQLIEADRDRVNYINMDTVSSKEACLKLLKDYMHDEETPQKKHFRSK
jgi:hypothetical protein